MDTVVDRAYYHRRVRLGDLCHQIADVVEAAVHHIRIQALAAVVVNRSHRMGLEVATAVDSPGIRRIPHNLLAGCCIHIPEDLDCTALDYQEGVVIAWVMVLEEEGGHWEGHIGSVVVEPSSLGAPKL